jgi:T4 RnlA family RNA ligase
MNLTQNELDLFNGLMKVTTDDDTKEAFFFRDSTIIKNDEEVTIRSWSYRLATWNMFETPYAKEARGTAFIVKDGQPVALFGRAYSKFFNLNEGVPKEDYMMDNIPLASYSKIDGSLIVVGNIDGVPYCKSKTSMTSDHAILANKLMREDRNLLKFIITEQGRGFTPIFELVSPELRIVLSYEKDELIYLGSVENETGLVEINKPKNHTSAETFHYSWDELLDIQENCTDNIEGFVVLSNKGFCKVKTKSYVAKHHSKDNVTNMKNLVQVILNDDLDDLLSLIDDPIVTKYCENTQEIVFAKFNKMVKDSTEYILLNNSKPRKEIAIELKDSEIFSTVMKCLNVPEETLEYEVEKNVRMVLEKNSRTETLANNFFGFKGK